MFFICNKTGYEYPRTDTAEELLEIAFIQGIIPAVTQDQVTKPKSKKEENKKDWESGNSVEEDDNKLHSSIYEF